MSGIVKEETRSVSPHCPKPNESEEPEGTAMEETAIEKSQHGEIVITKEMEEEEKHLVEEGEKKEREMMEEARQSWEKESQEMRFRRLQHLLEKSNIYSKFLLTKMEQQQQDVSIVFERRERAVTLGGLPFPDVNLS
ncbi:lymphoid-specific helicase-like [Sinocyclocheilus grahami]|uniref:lymphoid-specific helicase-like n=1 Tax=Sinocyclocheilus grahami TaxID=75366 RepID=UPI0007ACB6E8|nr:PREDICTED: lymphoid-specific helicase-like [Sinocyclocheilus grahami]